MANKINTGIIEDDAAIRDNIQKYLQRQERVACVLACESVEAFLSRMSSERPVDVLLLDIGLPGMSGIEGIPIIKERSPSVDILMLTVHHDPEKVFDSLRAGATGYLLKNTPLAEIVESIVQVCAGGSPMSPQIARKVIDYFGAGRKAHMELLTTREQEVVDGLVNGLSYKLIADKLHIGIDTVRFHIKNIYRKLHVNSRTEVVAKSFKGLL